MKVTVKKLADLHVMEKNIRRHTEKQLKEYVRSIQMFGQFKPLVVDEAGTILAGNGLFYALQSMGAETCDCYVMTGLTENQKKKLMLADNRVYELGFTDTAIFDEIIRDLGGDVDVPGWDADLLEMLNASVRDATEMVENYGVYESGEIEAEEEKKDYRALCKDILFLHPERYTIASDTKKKLGNWRGLFIKTYGIATQQHYKKMYEGLLYGDPKSRVLRILWTSIFTDFNTQTKGVK